MAKRFIKVYEQIVNWEWFRHPNTLCLFIYLLVKANYKDLDFHGKMIRRGQLLTSLPKIATDTGLSIQQTRTALSHLILTGEVTDEANHQHRLITVVKYDEYQSSTDKSTDDQRTINRRINRRSTDESTVSIEYIDNNRNIERVERIEHKTPTPMRDDFIEKSFAAFWACYPKKVSRQKALRAWKKIEPDQALADEIMTGLQKWSESFDWMKDGGRYIPYPATWLNDRRWEDDIPVSKPVAQEKQPQKVVVAQQYEQRDYSTRQEDILDRQQREFEEMLRRRQG